MGRIAAHFRSRGENMRPYAARLNALGSSPLTRGKPSMSRRNTRPCWLIPAHAGKTAESAHPACPRPAHPRSRGENLSDEAEYQWRVGSSPLTRGKRGAACPVPNTARLIPAHAGKTNSLSRSMGLQTAHPRSRGENGEKWDTATPRGGSSPLTRGKRRRLGGALLRSRLIPAHAGKTAPRHPRPACSSAHPRSRGEN